MAEDYKLIQLSQGKFAKVSPQDFGQLSKYKWYAYEGTNQIYYARRTNAPDKNGYRKTIIMHREIMRPKLGQMIDHIDHDGLNNVRSNLRICTNQENTRNGRPKRTSKSKYRGITWHNRDQIWEIHMNYKYYGRYKDEIEAAKAYDALAKEFYGEFAYLNFPAPK